MPRQLLMAAPNGARRGKRHHPALPITIPEIVQTAAECAAAGAHALHAHVRDAQGRHTLDAGLYRELLAAMAQRLPDFPVQITTESAGKYAPATQCRLLQTLTPAWASAAVRELATDASAKDARRAYWHMADAGARVQHILYSPDDMHLLADCIARGIIPPPNRAPLDLLFVLGTYSGAPGAPAALPPFLRARQKLATQLATAGLAPPDFMPNFMVCAFGLQETACLLAAAKSGGDCRAGFENNLHHPDGAIAPSNAARIAQVAAALALI